MKGAGPVTFKGIECRSSSVRWCYFTQVVGNFPKERFFTWKYRFLKSDKFLWTVSLNSKLCHAQQLIWQAAVEPGLLGHWGSQEAWEPMEHISFWKHRNLPWEYFGVFLNEILQNFTFLKMVKIVAFYLNLGWILFPYIQNFSQKWNSVSWPTLLYLFVCVLFCST